MSWGGNETHRDPLISWGGRMRSSLKLLKRAKGWLNCYIRHILPNLNFL